MQVVSSNRALNLLYAQGKQKSRQSYCRFSFQSWMDHRLKWSTQKWKLDTLNIKTYGHLWVPDINSER